MKHYALIRIGILSEYFHIYMIGKRAQRIEISTRKRAVQFCNWRCQIYSKESLLRTELLGKLSCVCMCVHVTTLSKGTETYNNITKIGLNRTS